MLDYERDFYTDNVKLIAGIDEAGRGPLAGPVVVASVIMPKDNLLEEVNDSKKLTEKKRERLFDEIKELAIDYHVEIISENEGVCEERFLCKRFFMY